jgi:hypothetical protein|tara:strand:- start:53 stop:220 length:168 start_codon:yes stop_codon:yes gene_type:complete
VKTTTTVFFNPQDCEAQRIINENELSEAALRANMQAFWVQSWCLESDMFVPTQNN